MTFLNPIILLGLVAAAVPLIIHLFNFRKPRRVEFSSLAFLREVERSTMRRVRIKQWLLLALRTLAIAAMVIAFARPTLRGTLGGAFAGASPVAVAVVVDNSPSMGQRDAGGAYFDQALALAREIVADTDARDEVTVLPVQTSQDPNTGPGGEVAISRLDEVSIQPGGRSQLEAVAAAAERVSEAASLNREIYLVGDLQQSTLVDSSQARISGDVPVRLVQVGRGAPQNVSVHDVEVVSRIVEADQPVRLSATLTNHGTSDAQGYVTSVFLDGDRMAQATTNLSAGQSTIVEFSVSPTRRGWLEGVVETEDDIYPEDNRAYFALHVPEERSVLLVVGDGQDSRFVEAALAADDRIALDVQRVTESQLPAQDLSIHDTVILAGPATISTGEAERLAGYVGAGGGVLWFPGDQAQLADYNGLLATLQAGQVNAMSPLSTGTTVDAVDRVDLEHPLFHGVLDASSGRLEAPEIFRRIQYSPGRGAETPVMGLSSGAPFLQEIQFGRGTVLLFAVAPDLVWSDLPTRGLFIPLIYRSIFLLSSSEAVAGERFEIGEQRELLVGSISEVSRVQFVSPSGLGSSPPSRAGVGGTLVDLSGLLTEAGIYRLEAQSQLVRMVAVNHGPAESELALPELETAVELLQQRSDATVEALDRGAATVSAQITDARRGADLWNVFLALALLFLAAEMIVAKQWKPESAS